MQTTAERSASYEVMPMIVAPERAEIASRIVRKIADYENIFDDFRPACEERCYREREHEEMCEGCLGRLGLIAQELLRPDARVWEVWRTDGEEPTLSGVIRVSAIVPGRDALAHYVFFDGDLRGKTGIMREVISWLFSEHEGWAPLKRLTVEIPDFAYALARHAHKKLGFGGPYFYELQDDKPVYDPCRTAGQAIAVEGVREGAVRWRGQDRDVLVLGLLNEREA